MTIRTRTTEWDRRRAVEFHFRPGDVTDAVEAWMRDGLNHDAVDRVVLELADFLADTRQQERDRVLHMGEPYSVPEVLGQLADAADHLLKGHDCDAHGWEGVGLARDAARRQVREMGARPEISGALMLPTTAERRAAMDDVPMSEALPATLRHFRALNVARCEDAFYALDSKAVTHYSTALAGEVGEACNLIRKMGEGQSVPKARIGEELADAFTYLDLLCGALDIDLGEEVAKKFDKVSADKKSRFTMSWVPNTPLRKEVDLSVQLKHLSCGDIEVTEDELQVLDVLCAHRGAWMAGSAALAANTRDKISAERVNATWKTLFEKKLADSTFDGPVIGTLGRKALALARQRDVTRRRT
jgi:NTP pyrophosphatase (non-canonical NTP hydrolase)